ISQNNNIPRIKGIIERICEGLGERKSSPYGDYYAFPSSAAL
ncbi:MAG TPA: 8-oxoguanine DNA glycosylase, partial [Clostridiales bacterium]|nr:8-oxoguanine DNA glycosylase [Clostridiales bacterium]